MIPTRYQHPARAYADSRAPNQTSVTSARLLELSATDGRYLSNDNVDVPGSLHAPSQNTSPARQDGCNARPDSQSQAGLVSVPYMLHITGGLQGSEAGRARRLSGNRRSLPSYPPSQGTSLPAVAEFHDWRSPQGVQFRVATGPPERITDPALLGDGFRASRYVAATSGDHEPLNEGTPASECRCDACSCCLVNRARLLFFTAHISTNAEAYFHIVTLHRVQETR